MEYCYSSIAGSFLTIRRQTKLQILQSTIPTYDSRCMNKHNRHINVFCGWHIKLFNNSKTPILLSFGQ